MTWQFTLTGLLIGALVFGAWGVYELREQRRAAHELATQPLA
jgi:hypothetical protein